MPETQRLQDHCYIKLGGSENAELMADQLEVTVESSLQLPSMAQVVVHDTKLKWVDDKGIKLGAALAISSKSEAGTGDLFEGEIVGLEPDYHAGDQRMRILAFDKLHRLTRGRKSRTYINMTDGDIVNKVASENGLSADVGPTSIVHKHVYQHNQTDLEFLSIRAARLGYVMFLRDGKINLKPPKSDGAEVEVKWGETLLQFNARLHSSGQANQVVVRGWDPSNRQEIKGTASNGDGAPAIGESKPGGQASKDAFGDAEYVDTDLPIYSHEQADSIAKARADQLATQYIVAEGTCKGNPKIVAGAKVKIPNVGERFSGSYTVTSARHVFDQAQHGYTTEFSCSGHYPDSVASALKDDRGKSLGERLAVGIVTNNDDPDKLGRVKVRFPWHAPDIESNWARVVTPGAGKERGLQFLPEVNDEVMIAFEMGDVDHPYVLGGLWNGPDKLARDQGEVAKGGKIEQRIIKSRSGHMIVLDDKDGAGGIYIEDRKGNQLHLESQNDKLIIKTKGNIEVETQADVSIKAQGNINIEASQELELKASTGITIDGGAKVDIKGGMVNVN